VAPRRFTIDDNLQTRENTKLTVRLRLNEQYRQRTYTQLERPQTISVKLKYAPEHEKQNAPHRNLGTIPQRSILETKKATHERAGVSHACDQKRSYELHVNNQLECAIDNAGAYHLLFD